MLNCKGAMLHPSPHNKANLARVRHPSAIRAPALTREMEVLPGSRPDDFSPVDEIMKVDTRKSGLLREMRTKLLFNDSHNLIVPWKLLERQLIHKHYNLDAIAQGIHEFAP